MSRTNSRGQYARIMWAVAQENVNNVESQRYVGIFSTDCKTRDWTEFVGRDAEEVRQDIVNCYPESGCLSVFLIPGIRLEQSKNEYRIYFINAGLSYPDDLFFDEQDNVLVPVTMRIRNAFYETLVYQHTGYLVYSMEGRCVGINDLFIPDEYQ